MDTKSDAYWKDKLSPKQYHVLREKGTDAPFFGEYANTHDAGTYSCAACGHPLFTSEQKFDAHCGWPSFFAEMAGANIVQTKDHSYGMERIELSCVNCGGHLGHLFDEYPPSPTQVWYCVNSTSINFTPKN